MQRMLPRYWEKKGLWPTKKQLENYCLRNVLAYKAQDDYTMREIERLNSLQRIRKLPVTNTWDIERPDFLFRDPTNKKRIIGIEHFEANKMSKEQPVKKRKENGPDTVINSYGKSLNKQIFNMLKYHKHDVRIKNLLTEQMLKDLSNHLEKELNFAEQSSVSTLTSSIKHSLNLHFSHLNEYIANIKSEFIDVEEIELNFMFDITSDFYGRFVKLPNILFDNWNILMLYNEFIDLLAAFNNKNEVDAKGNYIEPKLVSNFIINVHDHHNKMYDVLIIPNNNVKEYIEIKLNQNDFANTKMFCVSNLCHNFKVEYKKVPNGVTEYFSYDAFAYNCQWQKIYDSNQTKQLLAEMKKCIFKEPQLIFVDHNIWSMFCMEYPIEAWLILDMVAWYNLQQYRYLHMGQLYRNQ